MKFTTVILYFNKPTMTARCLASVRRAQEQTDCKDHHIILVNNGSTEDLTAKDCSTETLIPNQGFSIGMNTGLRAAFSNSDTRIVTLLSNDIELPLDFYSAFELLNPVSSPTIWCPHTYFLSDRTKASYTHGTFDRETTTLSHHIDPLKKEIKFPDYYPAAATIWNRAAFERLGGFDERYFCYWEDVELSLRCHQLGVQLAPDQRLRVHHLGRGTTGTKSSYSGHFNRGRELTLDILAKHS